MHHWRDTTYNHCYLFSRFPHHSLRLLLHMLHSGLLSSSPNARPHQAVDKCSFFFLCTCKLHFRQFNMKLLCYTDTKKLHIKTATSRLYNINLVDSRLGIGRKTISAHNDEYDIQHIMIECLALLHISIHASYWLI